jgi:hypothetical protein
MYPNGNIYDALSDSDTVVANMEALAAATLADKLAADADASAAHTSELNAAASLASLLASGATAAPLMDGVAAVGVATKWAREDHVHPTDTSRASVTYVDTQDALKAPIASPTFTGTPAAPTASAGTNTTQLANTAFVQAAITALIGGAPGALDTLKELADAINDDASYAATITAALALKAPLASPALTGTPTAPTATAGTNTTQLATTAFVEAVRVILAAADALKAPLASPALTGTPTAPTAAVDTNTTQLATTAMVLAQAASATPLVDGTAAVGTSTRFARGDHVHPTDTTRVALAGNQTITGGYKVTPNNLGNITSFTIDPTLGNYQYGTNHGAATWTAPANDCAVDILVTNDATAGAITFSGFTVGTSTGDALTVTNTNKFIISIRRLNGVSTYTIKALQ